MIVTVTLNPSVDISYHVDNLKIDDVNRVENAGKTAGGKGLNVTRVVNALGSQVLATGILGGTLGHFITEQLDEQKISQNFYEINKESRNCIAILHDGKQTEILESGPTLTQEEADGFLKHFKDLLENKSISVLTISGSLPKGLSADIYKKIISLANEKNIPVILDTSGSTLAAILDDHSLRIAAIKPNFDELRALEDIEISDDPEEWKKILVAPRFQNVEWIIISMGADGAFAKHQDIFYKVDIPKIKVVNPVGSGDSTVAGIAYSLENNDSDEKLLKTAMTTGMLNTMESQTGFINPDNFDEYFDKVVVTELK